MKIQKFDQILLTVAAVSPNSYSFPAINLLVLFFSGFLRDELGGNGSEHGGLLLHSDACYQTPTRLRSVLQPQGVKNWQLPQPGGKKTNSRTHLSSCQLLFTLCPVSEGPGSPPGPQLLSRGHAVGSSEYSAEGGGGEHALPGHLGCSLSGNRSINPSIIFKS